MKRENLINIDPVIIEIVGNLFQSIAEEMGFVLIRSAYSSNIKERRDCSTAVFDSEGKMVAQAEHIPMHLGSMLTIIEEVFKKYPKDTLKKGDMFIANDPYTGGGTHLPDITVAAPVFSGNKLIAWVANIAHHSDVGGKVPGSTSGDAVSIFQEGIRIPPVKFCEEGIIIKEIRDIILINCRTPWERTGDLNAQVAANKAGIRRLLGAYKKYGDNFEIYMDGLLNYTEKRLKAGVKKVKNGVYNFKDYMDDDGVANKRIPIEVSIIVKNDHISFDFSKSSKQVDGPINLTMNGLLATVFFSLKALIDPDIPSNFGIYKVFDIIAPKGLILNSVTPAPVGERIDTGMRVVDVIMGAMAEAIPHRVIAACNSSCTTATFSGIDPRTNEFFVYLETIGGGLGASRDLDGVNGVQVHLTNTSNLPIEALEIEYPLMVERYSLIKDSGGAGKHRGGLGIRRNIRTLAENITFSSLADRQEIAPWGLKKGKPGRGGAYYRITPEESIKLGSKISDVKLNKGDIISVQTPGSGGYGDPREREREAVIRDIVEGKISRESAEKDYKIKID